MNECRGRCHLNKKIKQIEQQEQQQTPEAPKFKIETWFVQPFQPQLFQASTNFEMAAWLENSPQTPYQTPVADRGAAEIFSPPEA